MLSVDQVAIMKPDWLFETPSCCNIGELQVGCACTLKQYFGIQ
jgi:hypothetical protein